MELFDTHCHVHFNAYKDDMHDVVSRSLAKGVQMVTIGTQKDTSRAGVELARQYDGLWAAVALHPNHLFPVHIDEDEVPFITREEDFDYTYYKELAQDPNVVAIGECGLDWYRIPDDRDIEEVKARQFQVFAQHLDLATDVRLPVIIHCRDAHAECAEVLEKYIAEGKLDRRGIIHCFTGTLDEAMRYIDLGFVISIPGIITFPPKKGDGLTPLQEVVKQIPLEHMVIETDAPYLTPVPYRGKRNEPWYVQFVAQTIAELKGISTEEVARTTTQTAKKLFDLIKI